LILCRSPEVAMDYAGVRSTDSRRAILRIDWGRLMSTPSALAAPSILVLAAPYSSCDARIIARGDKLPIEHLYRRPRERILMAKSRNVLALR
jgi:hypothetical protein